MYRIVTAIFAVILMLGLTIAPASADPKQDHGNSSHGRGHEKPGKDKHEDKSDHGDEDAPDTDEPEDHADNGHDDNGHNDADPDGGGKNDDEEGDDGNNGSGNDPDCSDDNNGHGPKKCDEPGDDDGNENPPSGSDTNSVTTTRILKFESCANILFVRQARTVVTKDGEVVSDTGFVTVSRFTVRKVNTCAPTPTPTYNPPKPPVNTPTIGTPTHMSKPTPAPRAPVQNAPTPVQHVSSGLPNTGAGDYVPWIVFGVIVLGFGAYFLKKSKE